MEKNSNIKNNEENQNGDRKKDQTKHQEFKKDHKETQERDSEENEDIFFTEEEYELFEETLNEVLEEDWFFNERIDEIERYAINVTEQGKFLSLLEDTHFQQMLKNLKEREIRESIVTETELENAIERKKQAKKIFEYITWSSYILGWFLLFFLQFIWRMRFIDYMIFLTSLWSHALFICFISRQTYPQTVPLETYEEVLYGGINVKSL